MGEIRGFFSFVRASDVEIGRRPLNIFKYFRPRTCRGACEVTWRTGKAKLLSCVLGAAEDVHGRDNLVSAT